MTTSISGSIGALFNRVRRTGDENAARSGGNTVRGSTAPSTQRAPLSSPSRPPAGLRQRQNAAPQLPQLSRESGNWAVQLNGRLGGIDGASEEPPAVTPEEQTTLAQKQAQRRRLERSTQHQWQSQAPTAQLTGLSRRDNGTLDINAGEALGPLLENTLNANNQRYRWHGNGNEHGHTLLDRQNRLIHLHEDPLAFTAFTHRLSVPPQQTPVAGNNGSVSWGGDEPKTVAKPAQALREKLTGIYHTGQDEQALRLYGDRLYQYTSELPAEWQPMHGIDAKPFSQLSRQGNGQLFALQDDKQLLNLSTGRTEHTFSQKVSAYALNRHGALLALTADKAAGKQQLLFRPAGADGAPQPLQLQLAREGSGEPQPFYPAAIALRGNELLAFDDGGRLHRAALPDGEIPPTLELEQDGRDTQIRHLFSDPDAQLTALLNDGDDRIHAVVKNRHNHEFSCQLDDTGVTPGWNLSDSMVMDYQKGLRLSTPLPHNVVDLGRLGKLALIEGKVHFRDEVTGHWEASGEKAERLIRGHDGQAYKVEDGEVKPLKINQAGNKASLQNNLFHLTRVRNSVEADLALTGLDKNSKTQTVTSLGNGRLASLNEDGRVQLHQIIPGLRRERMPPRPIGSEGLPDARTPDNRLKDLAGNASHQLFGLTGGGQLFSLAPGSWLPPALRPGGGQQNEGATAWQPVTPPPDLGRLTSLHNDAQGRLVAADDSGHSATWHNGSWQTTDDTAPASYQNDASQQTFDRLDASGKSGRIPKTGITYKREYEVFGASGNNTRQVNNPFKKRMQAFLFKPQGKMPRPLKNLGNEIIHRASGRDGLRPCYRAQQQLSVEIAGKPAPSAGSTTELNSLPTLETRLDALGLGQSADAQHQQLHKEIAGFGEMLGRSLNLHSAAVGKHYGVVDEHNRVIDNPQKLQHTRSGQFNRHSQRDPQLAGTLRHLLGNHGSQSAQDALQTLSAMENNRVVINHLKDERDYHDDIGLLKSRLFLDLLTQEKLYQALSDCQSAPASDPQRLNTLRDTVRNLRDEQWDQHPVKKLSDQGFQNTRQLEAYYDGMKRTVKAFSKQHHGTYVTASTLFQTGNREELTQRLGKELLALKNGEALTFGNGHSGFVSSVTLPGDQIIGSVGARVNLDRDYSLAFTREETGLTVTVARNGGGSLNVFGAAGVNVLTGHLNEDSLNFGPDGNHKLSPVVRFGASLPLNLQRQSQNSMTFSLSDNELPQFLEQLTTNQLRPMDMLDKAIDHKVKNGNVWNLSLDINASAQASLGLPMTNKNETANVASARLGGGLAAGANLLHGQRERSDAHNAEGSKVSHSDNRVRYLNQGNLDARIMVPVGVSSKTEHAREPIMATSALAARYTFDGRTKKKINMELAEPHTLDHTHIDKIAETLGKAFTGPADARVLATVQDSAGDTSPKAKLAVLNDHFLQHLLGAKTLNNSQHAAIRDLQKLIHQREAMDNKVPLPGALEYQSTYNNLAKLDSNSLPHWIHDAFRFEMQDDNHANSNANRIGAMMAQDPRLAGLIGQMQLSTDTKAEVTLELKDEDRRELVESWLHGNIQRQDLERQLQDRSKMRIKSIAFVESKSKGDGIMSPRFLIGGGSNVSIEKERKLGKISFSYGVDQSAPLSYSLEGELADRQNAALSEPLNRAWAQGRLLKDA
ncbi:AvrE-family type 3 secretion system effector [Serratia sp. JUb9]|uniref:AvrE-family type 3 secretion system effector n=1 Tax=Serratia sp. JUb9 TaxID=2724469 RepID=UPI00164E5BA1|nr:AvrE-family type 3 secretion system effector [Serratia sp. JUb9]QNK33110.1 AvrE-family type 3 secretion system effector [Serratia sp. JUb9]